jgi:uncharacterized membrane protein YobD (UPF0266 family)
MSRSHGNKIWYEQTGLFKKNVYVKYQSLLMFKPSEVMVKVKDIKNEVKHQRLRTLVSTERFCHIKYTCEISMPWHFPLKNYGQSSVFSSLELF